MEEADSSILAIDLGGTQIRAAYIRPDLTRSHRTAVPTDDEAGVAAVVSRICEVVTEVRAAARAHGDPVEEPLGALSFLERDTHVGVRCDLRSGTPRDTRTALHETVSNSISAPSRPRQPVRVAQARRGDHLSLIGTLPIVPNRIHDAALRRATHAGATATGGATL